MLPQDIGTLIWLECMHLLNGHATIYTGNGHP